MAIPQVFANATTWSMLPSAQPDCPLFTILPAEIRNQIFALALTSYDDPTNPYPLDRYCYRPGYTHVPLIDLSVLRTCQLIYNETKLLHFAVHEFVYWIHDGPVRIGVYRFRKWGGKPEDSWTLLFESISEIQKRAVDTIHVFFQQYYLEAFHINQGTMAKRFKITLQHRDWWSWESSIQSDDRLGICPWREGRTTCEQMLEEPVAPNLEYIEHRMHSTTRTRGGLLWAVQTTTCTTWGGQLRKIRGLERFEMEFKTDFTKKHQLEAIFARAKHWQFSLEGQKYLNWDGELRESRWTGVADLKHTGSGPAPDEGIERLPKRGYFVVSMTWKVKNAPKER